MTEAGSGGSAGGDGRRSFPAAVIQMSPGGNKEANVGRAVELLETAADRGAVLAVLPEMFTFMGASKLCRESGESLSGPTCRRLAEVARRRGMCIVGGTIYELPPEGPGRVYNTCPVIGPDGRLLGAYRKVHLFDAVTEDYSVRESDTFIPGDRTVVVDTPLGRLGLAICYDLRFPEFIRSLVLAGAEIVCLPAAFTRATGRDHWATLLQARAIENQCYFLAADQIGRPPAGVPTAGRSLIADPWGHVVALASDREAVVVAEVDLDYQAEVRRGMPCLEHRRPEVY